MEPFAWFVDAGYLYAAGGKLCAESSRRDDLDVDYARLLTSVLDWSFAWANRWSQSGRMAYLRTYWYDGAPERGPSESQIAIAELRGFKLRLGRLVKGRQKGVDSLVVRDLMRLSQNRAIRTAFLLSGDEDLREGMVEAQEMGVRVVLVGIEPLGGPNQAETLRREADDVIVLRHADLAPLIRRKGSEQT